MRTDSCRALRVVQFPNDCEVGDDPGGLVEQDIRHVLVLDVVEAGDRVHAQRLAALVLADPRIRLILFVVSFGYLTYLALRIAFAGSRIAFIEKAREWTRDDWINDPDALADEDEDPDEEGAGVHPIQVAISAHGWERPAGADDLLHLSKRTRLVIRIPRHRSRDQPANDLMTVS